MRGREGGGSEGGSEGGREMTFSSGLWSWRTRSVAGWRAAAPCASSSSRTLSDCARSERSSVIGWGCRSVTQSTRHRVSGRPTQVSTSTLCGGWCSRSRPNWRRCWPASTRGWAPAKSRRASLTASRAGSCIIRMLSGICGSWRRKCTASSGQCPRRNTTRRSRSTTKCAALPARFDLWWSRGLKPSGGLCGLASPRRSTGSSCIGQSSVDCLADLGRLAARVGRCPEVSGRDEGLAPSQGPPADRKLASRAGSRGTGASRGPGCSLGPRGRVTGRRPARPLRAAAKRS